MQPLALFFNYLATLLCRLSSKTRCTQCTGTTYRTVLLTSCVSWHKSVCTDWRRRICFFTMASVSGRCQLDLPTPTNCLLLGHLHLLLGHDHSRSVCQCPAMLWDRDWAIECSRLFCLLLIDWFVNCHVQCTIVTVSVKCCMSKFLLLLVNYFYIFNMISWNCSVFQTVIGKIWKRCQNIRRWSKISRR